VTARPNFAHIAARAYALELGWLVLPVDRHKRPIGKLAPHGWHDATADEQTIDQWWQHHPERGVAIACRPSGMAVVDVDPRHGGDDQVHDLEHQLGPLPETPRALTGGGGAHIYLKHPGVPLVGHLAPGVEIKAEHYVVAPPSVTTGRYVWELDPEDVPLAAVPMPWLMRMTDWPAREPRPPRSTEPGRIVQKQEQIAPADYLRALAGLHVDRRGFVRCPFHDDRTPSLLAYPTAERGWFCFGCKRGGSIYDFAGLLLGIESRDLRGATYEAVWRHVRTFYGLELEEAV
jgi:Bifunctional DNA primase/polymerase, N-terminal/CHC2 zinc finger